MTHIDGPFEPVRLEAQKQQGAPPTAERDVL